MDLNNVRLIEACYGYLIDKLKLAIKDELSNNRLVFESAGTLYQFDTYQAQPYKGTFVEYQLAPYELREQHNDIKDMYHLYKCLNLKDSELSLLANIDDVEIVKSLIFKLLINADLNKLSSLYPNIKTDNFVYNLRILENDQTFSIYNFPKDSSFNLVSIS